LGTTHLKAAAFDLEGRLIALAARATPTVHLPDGGAEYDVEQLYDMLLGAVREILETRNLAVLGVSVASMAETGVLVGADGKARGRALAWFDPRSQPQANALIAQFGAQAMHERSGVFPSAKHGAAKLRWLQARDPKRLEQATWLHLAEYVVWRLTGERATCPTLAARTLLYDLGRGAFDGAFMRELGLPEALLPNLQLEGTRIGLARGTGTVGLEGVPVALAGHDHPCAALGAGVTQPLEALVSTGTAEAVLGAMPAPRLHGAALEHRVNQGPLPVPGLYALQAGASASGGGVEWLRRTVLEAEWNDLEAMLESGASPSGLLWLPHLSGSGAPNPNPHSRGTLTGFTTTTTRSQLVRAALEGSAFELRRMLEGLEGVLAARFERITVTGGHARSAAWLQLKADVLGRSLEVPEVGEATLLGAALLGGVAGGVYADARQATGVVQRGTRSLEPSRSSDAVQAWYARYLQLHGILSSVS
jgi:xylulokinase